MPKRTENFAIELADINRFEDLRAACISYFQSEGVAMMSYHHLPPPGAADYDPSITVAAHGFPRDWVTLYMERRFYEIDPIPKRALSALEPFTWSSVREADRLTRVELDYLDAMARANFGDGVAMPVFGPHGRNGYAGFGWGKNGEKFSDRTVARLQWAAQLGHWKYCDLLFTRAPKEIRLSPREREILEWIAKGKSNSVIAEIVGISANTVDTYIRRIFEKMDVGDRVTAALRGLSVGIIG